MTGARARNLIAAVVVLGALAPERQARSAELQAFDGTWTVSVLCAKAPDGALPYTWLFPAAVHNGALLGHFHAPGTVPSGTLSGLIDAGGNATLVMQGLTGKPNYSVNAVASGSPFHYTASVHFERKHGTGKRNELRDCTLDFVKR